jgi:membrane-bound metal-dependent hydrolase YbcI (DUF457 family)
MNTLAHAIVSYAIGSSLSDDPKIIILAVIVGLLPDLDHIPHVGRALKTGRFGSQSRSRYHELYGLTLISILAAATGYIAPALAPVILLPYLAHQLMDYLTRPTRPFSPVDDTEVHMELYPKSLAGLTVADAVVTAAMIIWLIL